MIEMPQFAIRQGANNLMEKAMYTSPNFKTKKALKEAIVAGKMVSVYSPGPFPAPTSGKTTVEGPHYPEPHRWYAEVVVQDGFIKSVK